MDSCHSKGMKRVHAGFSLVEILVITFIVGVLAVIAIPAYNEQLEKAKNAKAQDFVGQGIESADSLWNEQQLKRLTYTNIGQVVARMQSDTPGANVRDYNGGVGASVGPNALSVTLDQPETVTVCAKATSGLVFCTRHDQSAAMLGNTVDTTTGNSKIIAFSNGSTEAAARAALPTRASAGSDSATGIRGWGKTVNCSSCTKGVEQTVTAAAPDDNGSNDFDYTTGGSGAGGGGVTTTTPGTGSIANTAVPTISGSTAVGGTLTASNGSWSGGPTSYGYQWYVCPNGTGCQIVGGATGATYVVPAGPSARKFLVSVTARNVSSSASASSAQSAATP
jgi:type II secretory pathway pseudopilin PulG